jgi:hypothetical protein
MARTGTAKSLENPSHARQPKFTTTGRIFGNASAILQQGVPFTSSKMAH